MTSRRTATAGVLFAGFGLALVLLTWPTEPRVLTPLLAVAAAATAGIFSARRHGRIGRRLGGYLAVGGGVVLTIGAGALLVSTGSGGGDWRLPMAISAVGLACLLLGIVEIRLVPLDRLASGGERVLFAIALGFGGLFLAGLFAALPAWSLAPLSWDPSPSTAFAFEQIGFGVGFVVAMLAFILGTGRGLEYLDLRRPARTDLAHIVGGTALVVGLAMAFGLVYTALGITGAEHQVTRRVREEDATLALVAIPLSWVAIALGEELLFRNGIQKYLTERFTPIVAIVASSAIFTAGHVTAFLGAAVASVAATLLIVFLLSLVLAVVYERTQNVVVPIVIHGTYNALVYLVLFLGATT